MTATTQASVLDLVLIAIDGQNFLHNPPPDDQLDAAVAACIARSGVIWANAIRLMGGIPAPIAPGINVLAGWTLSVLARHECALHANAFARQDADMADFLARAPADPDHHEGVCE